jgi:hypothetical protein
VAALSPLPTRSNKEVVAGVLANEGGEAMLLRQYAAGYLLPRRMR